MASQPSVLWIEEVDYIAKSKGLFYSFLSSLDSFECGQSLIIATTSKLGDVDKALRRGGRLDLDVVFEMPTAADRLEILRAHLTTLQCNKLEEQDIDSIAKAASGFVPSDLG